MMNMEELRELQGLGMLRKSVEFPLKTSKSKGISSRSIKNVSSGSLTKTLHTPRKGRKNKFIYENKKFMNTISNLRATHRDFRIQRKVSA